MLLLALLRLLVDEIGERIMQEAGHKLVKATFFSTTTMKIIYGYFWT
jgi:hypothetical protein